MGKITVAYSKIPGRDGKKVEYQTVYISTVEGLKGAEQLHTEGWKVSSRGLFRIQFYREEK